jgi:hypothetical protein
MGAPRSTPLTVATVAVTTTPFAALLVEPATYVTEAVPDTSVMPLLEVRRPPVVSEVKVKLTAAFFTRLLLESRTSTEIVELLLVCEVDPEVNATVPGTACTVTVDAVVATNITLIVAAGTPPGPDAVMIAGPAPVAVVDWTVTPVVFPAAFVTAGLPVTVPRLVVNVTA